MTHAHHTDTGTRRTPTRVILADARDCYRTYDVTPDDAFEFEPSRTSLRLASRVWSALRFDRTGFHLAGVEVWRSAVPAISGKAADQAPAAMYLPAGWSWPLPKDLAPLEGASR